MTDEDMETYKLFLVETRELLAELESGLLRLEAGCGAAPDPEGVNAIFRAAHTIKGGAGFFGLEGVKRMAHAMESALNLLREGGAVPDRSLCAALLAGSDLIRRMMEDASAPQPPECLPILETLAGWGTSCDRVRSGGTGPEAVPAGPTATATAAPPLATSPDATQDRMEARAPRPVPKAEAPTIRVNTAQLDKLMALAGELVLARNALIVSVPTRNLEDIASISQRLDGITSDLQEAIMLTRMQALGTVFGKFKRVIRDLALSLGKQIELRIEGEDVEVDKSIAEAINDPLTHLIRNAADHGIELPAERAARGKAAAGTVTLRAFHEGGQVVMEIRDDGAGIDPGRIRAKALEKGLKNEAELAAMGDKAILMLIFTPGFSTAQNVSEVSGRGVGMDVVQTNLAKVGGTVDFDSVPGKGSLVRIKVPLTLAIIPGLLVAVGGERFAIPQVNLVELVRVPPTETATRLEKLGGATVMRLRGALLPVVDIKDLLGIPPSGGEEPSGESSLQIAVVSAGEHVYGIVVDRLLDSAEIVVKPLGPHLSECAEYAGATILGDGQVAMIFDVNGLRKAAGLADPRSLAADDKAEDGGSCRPETQSWLILENGPGERFGIPLGLVARIERIEARSIVAIGDRRAITYHDASLVLLSIEDMVETAPRREADHAFVIVFRAGRREVGLLASEVVDAFHSDAAVDSSMYSQAGILGAAVLAGKIIPILDLHGMVGKFLPELSPRAAAGRANGETATILVVEDTPFFQWQFKSMLEEAGYDVLTAENGVRGLEVMDRHGDRVKLILTDIEMPHMDGFEMTARLRSDARHASLPIVAVTSLPAADAGRRGRIVGLSDCLIKLDRDQILEACRKHLQPSWAAGGPLEKALSISRN